MSVRFEDILWYLGLALKAALLWRLFSTGLAGKYKSFVFCIALQLARTAFLMTFDVSSTGYGVAYAASLPLLLAAYVMVGLDIYAKVFESYRGISVLGRGTMIAALAVSTLLSVIAVLPSIRFDAEFYPLLRMILLLESAVGATVLFFLVAIAMFLLWYPIELRRILLLYAFGFCLFFMASWAAIYLRNSDPSGLQVAASIARMVVYDGCLLMWTIGFRTSWELESAAPAIPHSQEHQRRLLAQLRALNDAMETSRKA